MFLVFTLLPTSDRNSLMSTLESVNESHTNFFVPSGLILIKPIMKIKDYTKSIAFGLGLLMMACSQGPKEEPASPETVRERRSAVCLDAPKRNISGKRHDDTRPRSPTDAAGLLGSVRWHGRGVLRRSRGNRSAREAAGAWHRSRTLT